MVVATLLRHKKVACGQSSYYFTYDNPILPYFYIFSGSIICTICALKQWIFCGDDLPFYP